MKIRAIKPNKKWSKTAGLEGKFKKLPNTKWWIVKSGKEIIGKIGVRRWSLPAGEVVVWIREEKRGQGWGHKALKLAIKKAKAMKKKELVYICREDNQASKRMIEKAGGMLVKELTRKKGNRLMYRIVISN